MSEERVNIFSNGTEFAIWESRNCDNCKKKHQYFEPPKCDLDEALTVAYLGDGTVSKEQATRLGRLDKEPMCREFAQVTDPGPDGVCICGESLIPDHKCNR